MKALERGASCAGPGQQSALLEARADTSGCPARGAGTRGLKQKSRCPWEGIGPRSRLPLGPRVCHNVRERGWTVSSSRGQRSAPGCSKRLLDGLPTPRRAISHPGPLRRCRVPRAGGHCPPGQPEPVTRPRRHLLGHLLSLSITAGDAAGPLQSSPHPNVATATWPCHLLGCDWPWALQARSEPPGPSWPSPGPLRPRLPGRESRGGWEPHPGGRLGWACREIPSIASRHLP